MRDTNLSTGQEKKDPKKKFTTPKCISSPASSDASSNYFFWTRCFIKFESTKWGNPTLSPKSYQIEAKPKLSSNEAAFHLSSNLNLPPRAILKGFFLFMSGLLLRHRLGRRLTQPGMWKNLMKILVLALKWAVSNQIFHQNFTKIWWNFLFNVGDGLRHPIFRFRQTIYLKK